MRSVVFIVSCFASLAHADLVARNLVVHESRASVPSGFVDNGPAPLDTMLNLRAALVPNDIAGLEQELYAVSTPSSKRYGQHLTKEAVEDYVKPSPESVTAVKRWLSEDGISAETISPAGDWLGFIISVNEASKLLDADFHIYTHVETGKQFIRTLSYSMPSNLKSHLDLVHPTITFANRRAGLPSNPSSKSTSSVLPTAKVATNVVPASCNSTITPACLQALYGIPTTLATQSSNVLGVASYSESADEADLESFLEKFRPDLPSNTTFALQTLDNGTNPQGIADDGLEADLDIQYTVGLASGVPTTFIVEGNSSNDGVDGFLDFMNFLLAESNPPNVVTTSYGDYEEFFSSSVANQLCNAIMQLGARGTSVLFASGDGGVSGVQPQNCTTFTPAFPSGCPYLTSVGATQGIIETAASFSSGGFSNIFPRPAYQSSAVPPYLSSLGSTYAGLYNASGRGYPDVATQGVNFEIYFRRLLHLVSGASAASPTFASVIALLNDEMIAAGKSPLGFLNPFLYSEVGSAALNDITSGNNPGCDTDGFFAASGWDPITGLGTPDYSKLKAAVGL